MKKLFVAVSLAALLLVGCSGPTPVVEGGAGSGDKAAAVQAEKPEAKKADRSAALGETVTYEGGVKVTVTSLGFNPVGEYAIGAVDGQAAVFELTVVNGGSDGTELDAVWVTDVTGILDLSSWPAGMRIIDRKNPGRGRAVVDHRHRRASIRGDCDELRTWPTR